LSKPKRPADYVYKGRNAYLFGSWADGKCHQCKQIVEKGEDAVSYPTGGDKRFFHKICWLKMTEGKLITRY
jgi:hypothetical protein